MLTYSFWQDWLDYSFRFFHFCIFAVSVLWNVLINNLAVNNVGGSFHKLSRNTVWSFSFYFIGFILHWVDQMYSQSLVLVFYHLIQRVIGWIFLHDSFLLEYISVIFISLGENCLYSEFFCSLFSRIWTDYRDIFHIFLHLV